MRVAVVTGGSRGIGRAIALRLAAEGARVIAASRRPDPPEGVEGAALDVTDAAAVDRFFAGLGRVDVLVNNAGLAGANALDDAALWHAIIATNLHGTYHCARAALARMPDGGGRIVTIASVLGLRGVADQTAYCAAKHAVIGFTRALALAVAGRGITVNAVCPGWVATGMAERRWQELGLTPAQAAAGVPRGRITSPEEVAEAVAFLAGPGAAAITGQALPIDGGGLALP
ncbi:3-oxoacyl-[acyl-carrier-protein] reductase FabG [Rhodovastum atsumiense]|uniref:SDR family oxidoreductase n=1 Tax=Rhodovastum atsumiense TaxID=504468 RepID=A0A5M6IPQ3_9PROT|nr:SDR family NAD(P)-dependent oxidoreductase [Rhodovastum atsumiense]KAA5610263.1 SDR family oxidoreductase [Rhodovastum atsumiense]CAH2602251.1 3-oxoacyl-[acyl-carrier-protein] reductase FabG [Rhodovastum atsumiense]